TANRVCASQTGTPSQTVSFPGAYSDSDPGSTIRACMHRAYNFPCPPMSNLASPADLAVVGRGIFDAVVHDEECYYKPTSTSGSDSGAQL
ncbi:hypothetical protein F5888DRAFT_1665718, partial [Russula emetica]